MFKGVVGFGRLWQVRTASPPFGALSKSAASRWDLACELVTRG